MDRRKPKPNPNFFELFWLVQLKPALFMDVVHKRQRFIKQFFICALTNFLPKTNTFTIRPGAMNQIEPIGIQI